MALLDGKTEDNKDLLGSDPKGVILNQFERYAEKLTCHIDTPTFPPPMPRKVTNCAAFLELIKEYHQRGYTIRIPDVTNISQQLNEFTRALEFIIEKPVGVVIFWSELGAKAPIHHDEIDVIVIQLSGTKRWFISQEIPKLVNNWKGIGEGPPALGRYHTYDVKPGDVLYLPRGTAHTVQSTSESIHLSIGFVPLTVRDTIQAVLDHLSDLDRPLRMEAGGRSDTLANGGNLPSVLNDLRNGLQRLSEKSQDNDFVYQALVKRRARMISDLPKLRPIKHTTLLNQQTLLRHNPLSIAQLIALPEVLDFRQPGELIMVHPGAKESLQFIIANQQFKIIDIPGPLTEDVRIALVQRLLTSGFLLLAD